ncbi:Tim10/DDP family zinc finger-domain-containing protein [Chaetomium sp. MPI-SDFR-AT-0129]|uniref:Mitochondrial import inner membrane translocase subunit n=1 Tax=Dichotomopilus funicola TaxID=1934379 RepID=A0AAN6V8U6_9PEZI|nr:Tim10/DDP family zinc finger-domain-containing protein [Chaetomium sp. MPI-SDFR-AT-0129]KAK4147013.1 Tim10/DDP family zinc finger-domain-containing protein [Dichotomopilus funicola]
MDSDSVKKTIMKEALQATNTAEAQVLIQNINETCFERCVPKPGSSLSSGEQTCLKACMEKYMAAWNQINTAYVRRIQQEVGNQGQGF